MGRTIALKALRCISLAGFLAAAFCSDPAYSQTEMSSDNACSFLVGSVHSGMPGDDIDMERWADLCSRSKIANGLLCRHARDLMQQKGAPYRALVKRMQCPADAPPPR